MFDVCLMVARGEGADVYYTELKRREEKGEDLCCTIDSIHRERTKHALFPHRIAERVQHRALFYRTRNVQYLATKPPPPLPTPLFPNPPFGKRRKGPQYTTPQHLHHNLSAARPHRTRSQLPSHPSQQAVNNPLNNPTHHPSKTTPPPTHPPHLSTLPKSHPLTIKTLVPTNSPTQYSPLPFPSLPFIDVPNQHCKKKELCIVNSVYINSIFTTLFYLSTRAFGF